MWCRGAVTSTSTYLVFISAATPVPLGLRLQTERHMLTTRSARCTMPLCLPARSPRVVLLLGLVAVTLVSGEYAPDVLPSKDDMSLWIDEQQVKQFFNGTVSCCGRQSLTR